MSERSIMMICIYLNREHLGSNSSGLNYCSLNFILFVGLCELCQKAKWQPGAAGELTEEKQRVTPAASAQNPAAPNAQHRVERSGERGARGTGEWWWWGTHQLWGREGEMKSMILYKGIETHPTCNISIIRILLHYPYRFCYYRNSSYTGTCITDAPRTLRLIINKLKTWLFSKAN